MTRPWVARGPCAVAWIVSPLDARPAAARSLEATPTAWRDLDASMGMLPRRRMEHVAVPDDAPATPSRVEPAARALPRDVDPASQRGLVLCAVADTLFGVADRGHVELSDLIVRAWALFPEVFGLRGYEGKHPDAARVMGRLSGESGPVALGYVRALGGARYQLTEKGARWWSAVGGPYLVARGLR